MTTWSINRDAIGRNVKVKCAKITTFDPHLSRTSPVDDLHLACVQVYKAATQDFVEVPIPHKSNSQNTPFKHS